MAEVSKTALEKARAALTKLLDGLQLSSVVLVDDECLDVSLALAKRLPALGKDAYRATLGDPEAEIDAKVYAEWKPRRFEELARKEPQLLARERRELIAQEPHQVRGPIEVLAYMCDTYFCPMTPKAWEDLDTPARETIAKSSLVLFDRQLGEGFNPGDALLGEFLKEFDGGYAAILTNVVDPAGEIQAALDAAQARAPGSASDPARSLVSSKQRLRSAAPIDFVEDLRITCAAPLLVDARNELIVLAESAHEQAVSELKESIDVRTLEHIVVRAARSEGSWEADALLRVLAIVNRSHAQEQLLAQPMLGALGKIFDQLRSIFDQIIGPDEPAQAKAAELMRRERYDPASLINTAGLPLACGDMFRVGDRTQQAGERLWMLLDQPCDLQLRDTKDSRSRISCTDLIAIDAGKMPKDHRYYDLPSGSQSGPPGEPLHLSLNTRFTVPFEILELCVFDSEGHCRIDTEAEEPPIFPQTPALRRRWQKLVEIHKMTAGLARGSEEEDVRKRMIGHGGVLSGEPGRILEWPIERIERLNEPYGQLALRAVSEDRSRFAFEPDLTRA
jgi:hypothetical protein